MRIHDHLTNRFERATVAAKQERGRGGEFAALFSREDSLAIGESSALLQAVHQNSGGPEREAQLAALQISYAAGNLPVNVKETSELLIARGFNRRSA